MSRLLLAAMFTALVLVPAAAAKECTTGVQEVCDIAKDAKMDAVFGEYADIGLMASGLVLVPLVLILVISLIRHAKPTRVLKLEVGEKVRTTEPGGLAKFKLEIENHNRNLPIDVFLEGSELPEGWSQQVEAAVVMPSGFRMPQSIGETGSFTLSSERNGAHRAFLTVKLAAPAGLTQEDNVDYLLKAVPVVRGKLRKGKSKKARLSVVVTPHFPKIQIARVSHEPARIQVGLPVHTRAVLVNKGDRPATDVAVAFLLNGAELDKKIVPSIGADAESEIEFQWTPQVGENKIRVSLAG